MAASKKINLTLIIICLLTVLIIAFVIAPLFKSIRDKSEEIAVQKQKAVLLESEGLNLKENEVFQESSQQFIQEVNKLFIDSEVPLEFVNFLENTSKKCQLIIDILPNFETKRENDSWPYSVFQLVSSGSFSDFLNFLEKLENSPYLIDIQNINISRLGSQGEGGQSYVKASFAIKVFIK
ncbi:MAG: hypothetical protein FJZ05_00315 [Candidatus Nealsonbacteria bacterium]|nr:hypothetical protein [Candidatus Nealsonbacteria bacterium]